MDLSCCQLKPSASRKYRNFLAPRDVYNFVKIKNQYNFIIVNNSLNIFPENFRKNEKFGGHTLNGLEVIQLFSNSGGALPWSE